MLEKLSSAKIMSAASLATSVPVMPMAMPMSASLRAGASLTPSGKRLPALGQHRSRATCRTAKAARQRARIPAPHPSPHSVGSPRFKDGGNTVAGHGRHFSAFLEQPDNVLLVPRLRAREDAAAQVVAAQEGELVLFRERSKVAAGDGMLLGFCGVRRKHANRSTDRLRRELVVAGDDDDADARALAGRHGPRDLGPRRVEQPDQPDERHAGLDLGVVGHVLQQSARGAAGARLGTRVLAVERGEGAEARRLLGQGEDAEGLGGHGLSLG
mmetsp:Transcript_29202/g.100711  ORF Transcript_29202/g.100711 Transcript_29202/m.100711 type:complete len:270 (+) Transcript_29202:1098-1907(+)